MEIQTIPAQAVPAKVNVKFGRGDAEAFVCHDQAELENRGLIRLTIPQANALITALSKAVVEAQR